ncbi:thiamine pyrophosphokinase [Hyaloraphidium curvatum]|nr:thiamine pyrophosphokinase [Hyaloraphidium curvatum]
MTFDGPPADSLSSPFELWCASPLLVDRIPEDLALYLHPGGQPERYALIVVNTPLCRRDSFEKIWNRAAVKICADGGANRLFDQFRGDDAAREEFLPGYIVGDLDSVRPEVMDHYAARGTRVLRFEDQDSTDLQKCITVLRQLEVGIDPASPVEHRKRALAERPRAKMDFVPHDLVVLGALNGRFDHCIASINTVFLLRGGQIHLDDGVEGDGTPDHRRVWLVSDMSVATVLGKGRHRVVVMPAVEGPTCGLMPLGVTEAMVVTKGLRWNLDHSLPLRFGGMVSTSNQFALEDPKLDHGGANFEREWHVVEIETDEPIVWTVEVDLAGSYIPL